MSTNWLDERIKAMVNDNWTCLRDMVYKHFGDLDPTAKDAEIAEWRKELRLQKKALDNLGANFSDAWKPLYELLPDHNERFTTQAATNEIIKLRAEVERLKRPYPVLREGGDSPPKGNLLYGENAAFLSFGLPLACRAWDYGPVPAFPSLPQECVCVLQPDGTWKPKE